MPHKPIIHTVNTVGASRLFRIEQVELEFANGARTTYERICGSGCGAVLIVPLLDDETVLLIREYAVGTDRYELALPKGRIETAETPESAALREIREEVGYGARRITYLKGVTLAPGYFGDITHMLLAQDLYVSPLPGDEPEPIEVVPWPLAKLDALFAHEEFTEARSLLALYLLRAHLDVAAGVAS